MKKVILILQVLVFSTIGYGQRIDDSPALIKQDYLQKSKNQKTAAVVMASGGGLLVTIGMIIWLNGFSGGFDFYNTDPNAGVSETNTGNALMIAGSIVVLGSIPLYIASGKNNRKAKSISLNLQPGSPFQNTIFTRRTNPSLALNIKL